MGGNLLRNIIICMQNKLLEEGIYTCLKENYENRIFRVHDIDIIADECEKKDVDILLVEATKYIPYTIKRWLAIMKEIRYKQPICNYVVIVDENSSPEVAKQVQIARSDQLIDAFIYSSVSGDYIRAVIESL